MKDSTLDPRWLAEMMARNPPQKIDNGNLLTGPVRLAFPNLFQARRPQNNQQGEEKFSATLLFPVGANLAVFSQEWTRVAREKFPKHWTADGKPVNLHSPFHDQAEKVYGPKPLSGYTPGGYYCAVSSKFRPQVVDANGNPIVDEKRVYPGVWAIAALNTYSYGPPQPQTGVSFGLQSVMIIADDTALGGVGSDPRVDFAKVTISAASNAAEKMAALPGVSAAAPASAGVLPTGGFVGTPGALPVTALPFGIEDLL